MVRKEKQGTEKKNKEVGKSQIKPTWQGNSVESKIYLGRFQQDIRISFEQGRKVTRARKGRERKYLERIAARLAHSPDNIQRV